MTTNSRNYMQQYTRTKSIRQVNKTQSSYKQLLQNSKTRQNSIITAHLRLSAQKKSVQKQISKSKQKKDKLIGRQKQRQKMERNLSAFGNYLTNNNGNNCTQFSIDHQNLLSSTQNMHNITNISYGKLNSKMKLKVAAAEKGIRSMSSNQELLKCQNNGIISSMVNIGVGLSSNKKKSKLVTLTSMHYPSSTAKKSKMSTISQHEQSRSISQSHNNSKYSACMAHEAAYKSIKKQINQNENTSMKTNPIIQKQNTQKKTQQKHRQSDKKLHQSNRIQIITLNSSMLIQKPKQNPKQNPNLDSIYNRVKLILQTSTKKQNQWNIQRNYYQARIKQLQKQVQDLNRKSLASKSTTNNLIESLVGMNNTEFSKKQINYKQSNYFYK